ncbi:hypothetical protein ABUK73_15010 [Agrobacterium sp. BA1120]|uniref:hypothetical protein n=1 Tax=Agrobacterium sp. BA1120 TaxID=3228927 RepID=UPI00336A5A74
MAVDHVATKKGLASALGAIVNNSSYVCVYSVGRLTESSTLLVTSAINADEIGPARDPLDLLRVLVGFYEGSDDPAVRGGAMMMIDGRTMPDCMKIAAVRPLLFLDVQSFAIYNELACYVV